MAQGKQRKTNTAKKQRPAAVSENEVEFHGGRLTILDPELAQKMRKWWEESKRESYAWAQIVLKPRTTTKNVPRASY